MTLKSMCEKIVEVFPQINLTWEEIFNLSPTGELFHVFEWYDLAILQECALALADEKPELG